MRIVRRAGYRRMPWKNGGGLTEEVAVFPSGSGVEAFDWRVSIAHVETDGPFSPFPGIDRTIALLDGAGLALDLPDGRTVELAPGGAPFSFPGEWRISSRNLDGPTIDLNVMTRRGRCTHQMQRRNLGAGTRFAAPTTGFAVFSRQSRIEAGGEAFQIERFDALSLDAADEIAGAAATADFVWIGLA
jgi:environmental stress-induced protein Ves